MKEQELKDFTKKTLPAILHNVLKEWSPKWNSVTEPDALNDFSGEIIGRLWGKALAYCKSRCAVAAPCSAEEVVATIIRKGLKKESISFRGDSFFLSLPNYIYVVKKCGGVFNARPMYGKFSYKDHSSRWVSMEKEGFADFVYEFDSVIPFVKERISKRISCLIPQIEMQCRIAEEIKALSEKYLDDKGIYCVIDEFENGNPKVTIFNGRILPIVQKVESLDLERFFQEVPEMMTKRPVCNNCFIPHSNSGTATAFADWVSLSKEDRKALINYFVRDDRHTHSKISHLYRRLMENGMLKVHFDFEEFDWVHMCWTIEREFPNLKVWYMVVPDGQLESLYLHTIVTNDSDRKYFCVDDIPVKVIGDLRDIREDCDVDKTCEMSSTFWGNLEICSLFEEDE